MKARRGVRCVCVLGHGGSQGGSARIPLLTPALPCPPAPQATLMREELHAQHARSLQDKDALRKQVRELSEKVDELQLQLFQREGQLLAVEGKLRRQQLDALGLVGLPRGASAGLTLPRGAAGGGRGVRPRRSRCVLEATEPRGGAARGPWPFLSPASLRKVGSSLSPPGGLLQGWRSSGPGGEWGRRRVLARPSWEGLPWWGARLGTPPHAQEWLGSLTAC